MNPRLTSIIVLIFSTLLTSVQPASAATPEELQAEAVLVRYFDALKQGDTSTLKTLLGGALLKKRLALLNNPTYPTHLINVYKDAQFQITGQQTINNGRIEITATLFLGQQDFQKKTFLLIKTDSADNRFSINHISESSQ